jgi:hypothetical protein
MRLRTTLLVTGGLLAMLPWAFTRGVAQAPAASPLPPLEAPYPLPPLPERSPRNANYTISARLDPEAHTIDGSLVLEWRNTSDVALSAFPFHLYWNAFRSNLSTSARGEGRRSRHTRPEDLDRTFGYTHVEKVQLLAEPEVDLTPSVRYLHPDDDNADDRTVMEVTTPAPVAPGASARFKIDWTSRIPYGDTGRAGWIHDYNFIVQWFPKIGVYWNGAWNSHQFHATTEFFADYGVYDVTLTVPDGFVVGATGAQQGEPVAAAGGTRSYRFYEEDVHDFAWTASRRFIERKGRFDDAGYPPVEIRALLQPEHAHLADRHIEAIEAALRSYGAWGAPYPYKQITVVDPAWNSASGGMEYPTLLTAGTDVFAPVELHSPESVTVHETGHQFWYGLVGNNEFEEAWLDEGFNTYHTSKTLALFYPPLRWGHRYFGPAEHSGWPVVAHAVAIGRGEDRLRGLRARGKADALARRAWQYRTADSYYVNSYGKPALTLQTLEALVGDETMTRILRTYARSYRFGHPTTRDFIGTVNTVTGQDWQWFFDQTFYSSDLCDYGIKAKNEVPRVVEGFMDAGAGKPVLAPSPPPKKGDEHQGPWESEVIVERLAEVRLPVEVLVEFTDGTEVSESWDGKERWKRFEYRRSAKVRRATVDPHAKIALDVNPSNNTWVDEKGVSRRAALKWTARWMLWLQNLLELHMVIG